HFAGMGALGGTIVYTPATGADAAAGATYELAIDMPAAAQAPGPNDTITFHVYIPSSAMGALAWVQPFVMDNANNTASLKFYGTYVTAPSITFGAWNTFTLALPSTAVTP